MRKGIVSIFLAFLLLSSPAYGVRVKEIATFEGIRTNHLIGYGLVVGLEGTGDKSGTEFTVQSLVNMLNRFGIRVDPDKVKVKNVAAVVVTADLPPLVKPGSRIDVIVSSIGDAKSLQGGTLLFTPLRGGDGEIYAVAQGPVSVGGFLAGGEAATVQKNHLTVGRIPNGGLVERSVPIQFKDRVALILREPDFTTMARIKERIDAAFGMEIARPIDGMKMEIKIPEAYRDRIVEFLSRIEGLEVPVDVRSKVVINERTGTIVMGEHVRISTVAVSHGNLSVEIRRSAEVSQPPPLSPGETVVVPKEEVTVKEEKARLLMLEEGVTIGDLVRALNTLGVTPRDLIAILQAIKAAGALQAELELI